MSGRPKKFLLLLLAAVLLFGAGRIQQLMNHDRDTLGLTRTSVVLENAPPALAFTTVALGGFRGLISNFLWIRANDLQQDDKFFEAAQLADWITKLEPTFTQVWLFQAWNMAYNISVKFKENAPGIYTDRWNWLKRGIDLLHEGLRYNPNSLLIYRELGWFFQHKMGQNLDDANEYYKVQWKKEMEPFFGPHGTNFDMLLHPQTPADFQQLNLFTNKYEMDPAFAKSMDEKYGPFDWRLPEAHAIYWGGKALDEADKNPDKIKKDDLITVRRIIYQSLLQSFHHGRVISNPWSTNESPYTVPLGPNLDLVEHVNWAYTNFYNEEEDPAQRDGILKAHRNFLRDAIYFLYEADRMSEAEKWFKYLGEKYPDKPIVENDPSSLPKTLTLDEYALAVVQIDIGETSQERVTAAIQGMLIQAYFNLALGDEDKAENLFRLAGRVYDRYVKKTYDKGAGSTRIPLPAFIDMKNVVARNLVSPQSGLPYAARAALATRVGLPSSALMSPNLDTTPLPGPVQLNSTNAPTTNGVSLAP